MANTTEEGLEGTRRPLSVIHRIPHQPFYEPRVQASTYVTLGLFLVVDL